MWMKRLTAATVLGLAAGAVAATTGAGAGQSLAPRPALVKAHGLTERSTLGSYCTTGRSRHGTSSGVCADSAFPEPRGHLPVHPGDKVHLRFRHNPAIRDHIEHVRVALARTRPTPVVFAGSARRARAVSGHPNRWLVKLPRHLGTADALDIFVRYGHGDAEFVAGIAPR